MANVLVVTGNQVGRQMAGPGARAEAIARALSAEHAVTLAAPQADAPADAPYTTHAFGSEPGALRARAAQADIVVFKGEIALRHPYLLEPSRLVIIDLYDPSFFENLVGYGTRSDREYQLQFGVDLFREQLLAGDFFMCANERQRDLWLGMLLALGRVNHLTYAQDPALRKLIDVVPFGLPAEPPRAHGPVLQGAYPGLNRGDKVVLWGGGIWPWLDPLLAVQAMAALPRERRDIKLFFLSAALFGGQLPPTDIVEQVRAASQELGLLGSQVFFNESWVPYAQRGSYLLEANAGLICHQVNLETHYSNRTRILDYLWSGLPVVAVTGDPWSEIIERHGLGLVVPPEHRALAQAMQQVVDTPRAQYRERLQAVAQDYTWDRVTQPLLRFCRAASHAADHDLAARAQAQKALEAGAVQRERELLEALAWHRLPFWRKVTRRVRKDLARRGLGVPPPDLVQNP